MILVCGGAGYIGSHCVGMLKRAGRDVLVLDNLVYGHRELVQDMPFIEGDLEDTALLEKVFSENNIEAVMHFSAYAYVGESVQKPEKYYFNNTVNTLNLLSAMKRHGVDKFIFSSTCATYGEPEYVPIDEKHIQNPVNPYGNTKLFVEKILRDYERAYGIKSVIFRYFNAAGASPYSDIGEWHEPETHLIPLVLDAASGIRENITVFGDDYDTRDGSCIRDYIHVTDIACAHILGLDHLEKGGESDFFNIGSEKGFSVFEIIKECEKVTGKKVKTVIGKRREGDPPVLIADAKKIKNVLGWKAEFSDINTVIKTAWDWNRKLENIK